MPEGLKYIVAQDTTEGLWHWSLVDDLGKVLERCEEGYANKEAAAIGAAAATEGNPDASDVVEVVEGF